MTVNLRSLIGKLDHATRGAVESAAGLCLSRTHYDVEVEHYLMKLLDNTDSDASIVLKHFKDQGFSVDDKVIKLMLSKIDVNPEFGPQLKSYLTEEAQTLLNQKKIDAIPDWNTRLNGSILSAAHAKS